MYDVIVVGGGPAGMFAAGVAAERGLSVLLLERNAVLGKKLKLTGNGRCNLSHCGEIGDFIEKYGKNGRFLYRAFSEFFNQDIISFFSKYGVDAKVEEGGKIYPVSDKSDSVIEALEAFLAKNKVEIKLNKRVKEVIAGDAGNVSGIMLEKEGVLQSKNIVIATGGTTFRTTGSSGDGYVMAQKLGHTISRCIPALVPLITQGKYIKELQGLTLKGVAITVYGGGRVLYAGRGDILFTHFGISGPSVLDFSKFAVSSLARGEAVQVSLNLKPDMNREELGAYIAAESGKCGTKAYKNLIRNLLTGKLCPVFVELSGVPADKKCSQLTAEDRHNIIKLMTGFSLGVEKSRPMDEAMVTSGGVSLEEINPRTMESKLVKGLYFCGEVIDIDGFTGGYNLQAAFSTAYLAAMHVNRYC